jgi:hypothetical protein
MWKFPFVPLEAKAEAPNANRRNSIMVFIKNFMSLRLLDLPETSGTAEGSPRHDLAAEKSCVFLPKA